VGPRAVSTAFCRPAHRVSRSEVCVAVAVVWQTLGWYDPLKKETNLNAPAIKKWLANGAEPSDSVKNLLKKAMVIE
jgi:hypothetical protein